MHFRIAARTILQLGAELISSDEIAFYELIKNAIDAQVDKKEVVVNVEIVNRIKYAQYVRFHDRLLEEQKERGSGARPKEELKDQIADAIDDYAPGTKDFKRLILNADTLSNLLNYLEEANYVEIKDAGEGMSLKDLEDVYLTIGTRSRQQKKQTISNHRPYLGEKGVGRLSVMRLGQKLKVTTTKKGNPTWNMLEINWDTFSHESEQLVEEISVSPQLGATKKNKAEQGTSIFISGLNSEWHTKRVEQMLENEFSRFTDPFNPKPEYIINVKFNGISMDIPGFDRSIFKFAHATVDATFNTKDNNPCLEGKVDYRLRGFKKSFKSSGADLISEAKVDSLATLSSLGPFKVKAYWYNRQMLDRTHGVPNFQDVRKKVTAWAGGLMLYRDGFRVKPYGSSDDDWLDLDKKALASGGYKVNRRQIIGKVEITSRNNPELKDQTNREGLRESAEKKALINLLKHILEAQMRAFLNYVEKNLYEESLIDLQIIEGRVKEQVQKAVQNVQQLINKYPEVKKERIIIGNIYEAFKRIEEETTRIKEQAEFYKQGNEETVYLAGIGLMAEMIAHELAVVVNNTLNTLGNTNNSELRKDIQNNFVALEAQLGVLLKRLRFLEESGTIKRQSKVTFDLVAWIKEILNGQKNQFERHNVKLNITVIPNEKATLRVKAVKGMIVQIFLNLVSNSIYWLDQQRKLDEKFLPRINIVINTESKEVSFTDNGPGIDTARREEIFLPFVTTKPSGEGKGLGLYIAREIANYHDAILYLSETPAVHPNKLNTFIFALEAQRQ